MRLQSVQARNALIAARNPCNSRTTGWTTSSTRMPNILIPVDRTIQALLKTLKQTSCADREVLVDLNAPNTYVWASVQDFELILLTMARLARYAMGAPDRIQISTWESQETLPARKVWLKFIAQVSGPAKEPSTLSRNATGQRRSEAALVDVLRLRTHVDTMPAHLAELVQTSTQLKIVLAFKASTLLSNNRAEDCAF